MTASIQSCLETRLKSTSIPRYCQALLAILNLKTIDGNHLRQLNVDEWRQLLSLCDASQLTLLLGHLGRPFLPVWVQERIHRNFNNNALRFERLKAAVLEITQSLTENSIEFALLKGCTHSPVFTPDPLLRAQNDIDIWCRPEQVFRARDILAQLGYRPFGKSKGRHLDPMIRESSWAWAGDYFSLDLPMPVDLHYELWDRALERIAGPNEAEIWARRSPSLLDGQVVTSLDLADTLAFAALHFMMHLFHGDLRLQRAWEIAYFLQHRADDDAFWSRWKNLYGADVRRIQAIAFLLVSHWFECALPNAVTSEFLPEDIQLWLARYSFSPIESLFFPNKDELWLNLALVPSFADKARVVARRLLPIGTAIVANSNHATDMHGRSSFVARARSLAGRARRHTALLSPTLVQGIKWWWARQEFGSALLLFTAASAVFDFGEFVFFLLYNLFLLELGYNERLIGQIAAAFTAGTFIGAIPAAALTRRYGLRAVILIAIIGSTATASLRVFLLWRPALLGFALVNGIFMSFWAVSMPPAIAGLTTERNRAFGFGLIASVGIGVGAVAGLVGGQLSHLLSTFRFQSKMISSQQLPLLLGALCLLAALIPLIRLRFTAPQEDNREDRIYPRSFFVYAFMASLFLWSLGTGGFNPFFNVYFSRNLGVGAERIGLIFSLAQMTQVFAVLLAPLLLKRVGATRTVAGTQCAAAMMLACLAVVATPAAAGIIYIAYMSFQYASEPCLLTMLMTGVAASEQSGASVLNFMVISLAGILAAAAAGALFSQIGYRSTLLTCAAISMIAALSFYRFVRA